MTSPAFLVAFAAGALAASLAHLAHRHVDRLARWLSGERRVPHLSVVGGARSARSHVRRVGRVFDQDAS